jgi:hypothetical protein
MKPTKKQLTDLWNVVENFIQQEQINCPETIAQTDRVIENAYEFIENCCNVVGYYEYTENE